MNSLPCHQVECPRCHAPINSTSPFSGHAVCCYCGTPYHITANIEAAAQAPELIIPFANRSGDFELAAQKMLAAEDYAPVNIAEIITFSGIRGHYIPAYLFEGEYRCTWSCRIGQPAGDGGKPVYRPHSGTSEGHYAIVCVALEGGATATALAEYVGGLDFCADAARPFRHEALAGYYFATAAGGSQQAWQRTGEQNLNCAARKNTLLQFASSDIRDFRCSVTPTTTSEGRLIYCPLWIVGYRYCNQPHHIMLDGAGRGPIAGSTPADPALKRRADGPFAALKYIAGAAIAIPLLMLLMRWYAAAAATLLALGLLFFAFRYYARCHRNRVIHRARTRRNRSLGLEVA